MSGYHSTLGINLSFMQISVTYRTVLLANAFASGLRPRDGFRGALMAVFGEPRPP